MKYLEDYIRSVSGGLYEINAADIEQTAKIISEACLNGGKVIIFGNGGSAATASHFACDLSKGPDGNHVRLPVISLTDNIPLLTAVANDIDYAMVFKEQLACLLRENDVVIGISASGNSPNVLNALSFAVDKGAYTLGIGGFGGGKMAGIVDKAIVISLCDYRQVEDVHMAITHIISMRAHEIIADQTTGDKTRL
ncbi:SIS domain-containing protein [Chloroflexota bacterium]